MATGNQLQGIGLRVGTTNIVIKGHINKLDPQFWILFTVKIFDDNFPKEKQRFYMNPDIHTIEREYFYNFDIRDFFILNNPIKSITPLLYYLDPVSYDPIYLPLPSWLKFDQQTQTFSGRPRQADYPSVSSFPIILKIVLNVTDT